MFTTGGDVLFFVASYTNRGITHAADSREIHEEACYQLAARSRTDGSVMKPGACYRGAVRFLP